MKYLLFLALFLAGCTSKTDYGPCIGVMDDKNPLLRYKVSTWNVVLAVVFSETLFVPILVLVNQTSCPVGVK